MRKLNYNCHQLSSLTDYIDIHDLLINTCHLKPDKWFDLGMRLGLQKGTLDVIRFNNSTASECLFDCLSKWLRRADNVDRKGGATWDSLSDALQSMGLFSVATSLDIESKFLSISCHFILFYCRASFSDYF